MAALVELLLHAAGAVQGIQRAKEKGTTQGKSSRGEWVNRETARRRLK